VAQDLHEATDAAELLRREADLRTKQGSEVALAQPTHISHLRNCARVGRLRKRVQGILDRTMTLQGPQDVGEQRLSEQASACGRRWRLEEPLL
jgi:hypothetical protein